MERLLLFVFITLEDVPGVAEGGGEDVPGVADRATTTIKK